MVMQWPHRERAKREKVAAGGDLERGKRVVVGEKSAGRCHCNAQVRP